MSSNRSLHDSLLTKREVAELIGGGASIAFVTELVRRGKLPQIKLGYRTVRFDRSKVEQAIRNAEIGAGVVE